ncbi:MAG: hypothetical protein KDC87_10710 [Planctomycetes bacterium]|nr:hypothetical protein [Planctomycetota bacterium]MCA9780352.1 hypothetical protein [Candidatus Eremiobacteraeota bacterium]MCB9869877.1 hypothetical protein [Planctomycetota bacterium]MCB9889107.1 hypothetical protein [Planctomycetota bacterium]
MAGDSAPAPGTAALRAKITRLDTGYYRIPAFNAVSRVPVDVTITDASGEVLDQVAFVRGVRFDVFNPSTGGRLRSAANQVGADIAAYLAARVKN